jgi:uncharacterized protein (DUF433 family)
MAEQRARIVTTPDVLGGEPRIEGRRIGVLQVHEQVKGRGSDPGAVASRYDLDVADVYRALAYYHENVAEMTAVRKRREAAIEDHRESALTPDERDTPTPE